MIHILKTKTKEVTYKVMPWRCRKWRPETFETAAEAYDYGMEKGYPGFRVYQRTLYDRHTYGASVIIKEAMVIRPCAVLLKE